LEKKTTGCHNLVASTICDKTAPVAKSLVFIDNLKESSLLGIFRTRAVVKTLFSISKAFCYSISQVQILFFLFKLESESSFDILVKLSMNLQ